MKTVRPNPERKKVEPEVEPTNEPLLKLIFVTEGITNIPHFIFVPEMLYYAAEIGRGFARYFQIDDYYFRRLNGTNGEFLPEITATNANLFTREAIDIVRKNLRLDESN